MENIAYLPLSLAAAFCAYRAMVSKHLLPSTLYLACVSASISVSLYMLGAHEVAVIELSVGAGLVTVLLVYTLSVVGEDTYDPTSIIPKPLAFVIVGAIAVFAGWMTYPVVMHPAESGEVLLADVLWKQRALDVWVQVALIFSGVMGVLGLLSERTIRNKEEQALQMAREEKAIAIQLGQDLRV